MTEAMAVRRRREIEFLARDLFAQAQGLMTAVGDLVPAELAGSDGDLADGNPLRAVAQQLDDALLCFDLLQEELGLPAGAGPRYGRLLGRSDVAQGVSHDLGYRALQGSESPSKPAPIPTR